LTVFNGSPRGKSGNTNVLLKHLLAGFEATQGNHHELFYLRRTQEAARFAQAFGEAEWVLLAFPLYTDAMPGLVKAFMESLAPFCGRPGNLPIGFMVQSGFPEAAHSRHVERYLEKLAARLGCRYLGTIVKGGCEGVRLMPEHMNRKLFTLLYQVGETFGRTGEFDSVLLRQLSRPERYSKLKVLLYRLLLKTRFGHFYWDNQLKKNGVYERRFARPYAEQS
jgi:hypothetical protein